ncbi:NitT/TauT family transport system substrate-binding protein [Deinobacterium chartae]|uniref:NitT/TauT family transport system substrate-binding protein n=1 Tax=Deinobacterium chartae TaxID=521158 RepID=A0A841I370_9DEIO|nr:ABC transporter substrate-binding protein [Deinobacterium chartae]MBB6098365.1 NitT/TauT family transport system substrate-binding protein [Deinobacterium chartae]
MKRYLALLMCGLISGCASAQQKVVVGLGYIPNVQFAPFYAAEKRGFYKAEGLEVEFRHGYVSELVPLLLQGKLDYVVGDAEDAVFARAQGAPLRYVMAMYQRLPVTIFSLPAERIESVRDLRGKVIGIPGAFGSSYTALQALLAKNGLKESDVRLNPIGFTQIDAVRAGKVDAAVGFVNNEVVVLREQGVKVNALDLSRAYPMVGSGVIASEKTLASVAGVKKFLRASQRGLAYTLANPQGAYQDSLPYIGSAAGAGQLEVLKASLPYMRSAYTDKNGLGYSDPAAWASAVNFLKSLGRLKSDVKAGGFYSNAFLTRGVK